MSKRPTLEHAAAGSSKDDSSGHLPPAAKRARIPQFLEGVTIHIIPAKLTTSLLAHLSCLAETHGAKLVPVPNRADIVLTAVFARKRLERHMDWAEGARRWVLRVGWLEDSAGQGRVMPFEDYLAVPDLRPRSPTSRPATPALTVSAPSTAPSSPAIKTATIDGVMRKPEKIELPNGEPLDNSKEQFEEAMSALPIPKHLNLNDPESEIPLHFTPGWSLPNSRYACKRRTPLYTPNEKMLNLLKVIMRSRELEGEDRSALSYARGISVLKAYPREILKTAQVRSLPGVGPKICLLIDQYLETGHITEADTILASERYEALSELTEVHSIGSTTARALYAKGIRNIPELREWVAMGNGGEVLKMALEIHDELMVRIPRPEVELIVQKVHRALDAILPGCMQTTVGGYRRGKPTSGDVDIVFTHPQQGKEQGLVEKLVNYLSNDGFITHIFGVMHPGHNPFSNSSHTRSKIRPTHPSSHFDTLSKALVVCKLPPSEGGPGIHRRLDLICAPRDVYWCAVVGWSGSKQFERDLRLWAKKELGIKFDSSGLTRLRDTQPIYVDSEKEVFELLNLEYVPPHLRNADL